VSVSTPSFRETIPRGLLILVGMATATIAVWGMKAIAGIITPSFLALVLVICVQPLRLWLIRKGLPRWVAALAVVLAVYLILILMIVATVVCLAKLATLAPSYTNQANDLANNVVSKLKDLGVDQSQINNVAKNLDFGKLFGVATTILSSILGVLSNLLFIGLVTLFLAMDNDKFVHILGETEGERPTLVTALNKFASSTRTYFIVATIFGFIVAVIDTGALYLLGIPAALVWGVLAFVTNFIPNIGFIIGLIPPAILGLLQGGWGLAIAVIVVYCVINFIIQSVLQPKFQGDALGLTTTLTFLSLVFWTFVLGPLGAILALPMTLLAKALIVDVDPDNVWMAPLLSGVSKSEESRADKKARKAAESAGKAKAEADDDASASRSSGSAG
jgi:AI-2 transport protein TqsA